MKNGEKIVAKFLNGAVHGFGTFYTKDGKSIVGKWKKGELIKILSM